MIAAARQAAARHPDRAAACALAVVVLVLFAPAVFAGRVFFQRDIHSYWYPHIENAVQAVAEGGWPAWTPYVAFGRPLLGDPSLQLFYPPTWLNLLVRPSTYYTIFAVAHVWAAGFGAYRLAREIGLLAPGAALAGLVSAASGPLLSAVNLFHHFAGAAWMPWVLWMAARALRVPTVGRALALGAVAGGQALAGSADMCLLTAVAATLLTLVVLAREGTRGLGAWLRAGVLAVVFAGALASIQWLPALALLRHGARAAQDVLVSSAWSVHPASLADLLVPRLVADLPLSPARRLEVFDGRGPLLVSLYFGAACLPLAALALLGRAHLVRVWAVGALALFLVAALGRHTAVYPLFASAPPFSLLRYPTKYMLPAALFWALLVGRGLDVWSSPGEGAPRRRLLALAAALAVVAALLAVAPSRAVLAAAAGRLWTSAALLASSTALVAWTASRGTARPAALALMGTLAVADLVLAGRSVNPLAVRELFEYRPPVVARIQAAAPDPRAYVRQESAERMNALLLRGPGGWDSEEGWTVGHLDLLVPPAGARWRVAGSYDGDFTGLAAPAQSVFSFVLSTLGEQPLSLRMLRLGAVTHVTALRERPFPGLRPSGAFPSVFAEPVRVFDVPEPMPRVYVVGGARAVPDQVVIRAINDDDFDARKEVLLSAGASTHPVPAGFQGTARVLARRMDRLAVEVEASAPGWLVVVEAFEPGWTARLDGTPSELHRANGLFRAVAVPAGVHRVELAYEPPGLRAGAVLTTVAAVAGIAAAAWPRVSRKMLAGERPA